MADVCLKICCITWCTSVAFEQCRRVDSSGSSFCPFPIWTVIFVWWMTKWLLWFCFCVPELSCAVDDSDFYCISLCLYGSIFFSFFMKWWNINTWKCETAESLASGCVWMSVGCGSIFGSALDFLVFCFFFLVVSFQIVFLIDCFIQYCILYCVRINIIIIIIIIIIGVISPCISKFWLRVEPAYMEVCSSNTVFSFCSSSYIYLNMMSFCFDSFFLCWLQYAWSEYTECSHVVQWRLFPFFLFLHWLCPDAFLLYRLQLLMQWAARNGNKMVYYHIV